MNWRETMPTVYPVYSTLFSTLYDEQEPIGSLGRGTHYSVLRSVEWLDVTRTPVNPPQIHDFTVIWDEDHDTRVMEAIEKIYMAGLMSPVQFIGERKGTLTVIVAARYYFSDTPETLEAYERAISEITRSLADAWPVAIGIFDRSSPIETPYAPPIDHQFEPEAIINAPRHNVITYLRNIDSLWSLGTKDYQNGMALFYERPEMPPIP